MFFGPLALLNGGFTPDPNHHVTNGAGGILGREIIHQALAAQGCLQLYRQKEVMLLRWLGDLVHLFGQKFPGCVEVAGRVTVVSRVPLAQADEFISVVHALSSSCSWTKSSTSR